MTPELRKEASELQLHKRGIRINVQLHVIESDDEVQLRSVEEVRARIIGLWAITMAIKLENKNIVSAYLSQHHLINCLSEQEKSWLFSDNHSTIDSSLFAHRHHALAFLCWCAGLLNEIDISRKEIDMSSLLSLFPSINATPSTPPDFLTAIALQRKVAVMNWSDLLYRLHWAVRHAQLTHQPSPGNINGNKVREWHQAVNWMCCYDDESNWDKVSTETSA